MWRWKFWSSAGPVKAMRQLPPYLPVSLVGLITSGCSGRRFSTGGSLPSLTSWAVCGDSLNCLGVLAGSVMISGCAALVLAAPPPAAPTGAGAAVGAAPGAGAAAAGLVGAAAAGAAAAGLVGSAAAGPAGF